MNLCKGYNNEFLEIGDYVASADESLNISGIICSINYHNNQGYISIKDENGEILMFDINAKYFKKIKNVKSIEYYTKK